MSRSPPVTAETYLYGIIRTPGPRQSRVCEVAGTGVGSPPARVRLLPYEDLAAIVSTVDSSTIGEAGGVRGFMRDMAAHADVLNRVLALRTVLPGRFGMIFPDDRTLIREILAPQRDLLLDLLQQLKRAVELRLSAEYVEAKVLEDVIRSQPQLARQADGASYHQRIDVGRRIARAIQQKRSADAQWILDRLSPAARDVSVGETVSELAVLRASFLVDRAGLQRFDRTLEGIQTKAGDTIRFACVGPLPPYSFAELRIPAAVC